MKTDYISIMVTCSDKHEAEMMATALIENKIAACVNIINDITSIYSWDDKIQKSQESLLIIKTKTKLFDYVHKIILDYSSYDIPEILALPILAGNTAYLAWMKNILTAK